MPKRILEGKVVSTKMDKSISVIVERSIMHPIYKKYMKKSKKFIAHDENGVAKEGEKIRIIECPPMSKRKSWTVYTGEEATTDAKTEKKSEKKLASKPKKDVKEGSSEKAEAKKLEGKKPAAKKEAAKKDTKKETKKDDK